MARTNYTRRNIARSSLQLVKIELERHRSGTDPLRSLEPIWNRTREALLDMGLDDEARELDRAIQDMQGGSAALDVIESAADDALDRGRKALASLTEVRQALVAYSGTGFEDLLQRACDVFRWFDFGEAARLAEDHRWRKANAQAPVQTLLAMVDVVLEKHDENVDVVTTEFGRIKAGDLLRRIGMHTDAGVLEETRTLLYVLHLGDKAEEISRAEDSMDDCPQSKVDAMVQRVLREIATR